MSSKHNPSSEITNLSETNLTIPKKQLALLKKIKNYYNRLGWDII